MEKKHTTDETTSSEKKHCMMTPLSPWVRVFAFVGLIVAGWAVGLNMGYHGGYSDRGFDDDMMGPRATLEYYRVSFPVDGYDHPQMYGRRGEMRRGFSGATLGERIHSGVVETPETLSGESLTSSTGEIR